MSDIVKQVHYIVRYDGLNFCKFASIQEAIDFACKMGIKGWEIVPALNDFVAETVNETLKQRGETYDRPYDEVCRAIGIFQNKPAWQVATDNVHMKLGRMCCRIEEEHWMDEALDAVVYFKLLVKFFPAYAGIPEARIESFCSMLRCSECPENRIAAFVKFYEGSGA